MKTIEKITRDGDIQYFEKLTNKDLSWLLKCLFSENVDEDGLFNDEDSSAEWYLKDGSYGCLCFGWESPKKPAIDKIERFVYNNPATTAYRGKGIAIVQNEKYGDWEIEIAA
jgi:hypothetical protein